MSKALKIASRLILVLGLIVFSFKPSVNNRDVLKLVHYHRVALDRHQSVSRRVPLSSHDNELRCNFQKNEEKRRLPVAVVAVPTADVFAFNVSWFNSGASVVSPPALSLTKTVVLRI